jgi:ferredoxin-type protein NapF
MGQRLLKPLRVVLALAFFAATLALFLDLAARIPAAAFEALLYLQPTPSLIRFLGAAGWAAAGFGLVLLLTLLFGRVFCSTICPLGTLQDLVIWASGRLRREAKRVRFRYRRPQPLLRFGLLAATLIAALGGSMLLVAQLDPFSHFGRILGLVLRPVAVACNNLAALALESLGSYLVAPLEFALADWEALALPVVLLAGLLWMSARHGRLFCNTLCPLGTFLGLVSRVALFRVVIDADQCSLCARCSLQCKAECIHLRRKGVDFDRCVACFNCIPACPEAGIGYRLAWGPRAATLGRRSRRSGQPPTSAAGFSLARTPEPGRGGPRSPARRAFLRRSAQGVFWGTGIAPMAGARDWPRNRLPTRVPVIKRSPVAPPGAGSITRFNAACTACQLCVSVCPTQVLQPSLLSYGAAGFLQPHMSYETAYCTYECVRCAEVCPTDAIRPLSVAEKKRSRIGTAHFIEDNCIVVTEKTACGACAEHCPTQAVHMIAYEAELTVPALAGELCIGCGACEHVCPVRPHRAIYVDGEPRHQPAEAPPSEVLEIEVPKAFPF